MKYFVWKFLFSCEIWILFPWLTWSIIYPDVNSTSSSSSSSSSSRKPKFFSFFKKVNLEKESLENLRADIESAKYLLEAIEKTSVTKEQMWAFNNKFNKPFQACPFHRGSVRIGKSCYEYFPQKLTFARARQVCRSFEGDLASIDLQTNFLSLLRKFYPKLAIDGTHYETWIGATRVPGTSNFQFFDGRIIFSSNARWNSGPKNYNCLILDDVDLVQDFIIDDCDCYNQKSFLCQYPLRRIL